MYMRRCSACGEDKPLNQFPRNGVDPDGRARYRHDCKLCYGISRKLSKKKHNKFVSSTKHRTGEDTMLSLSDWKEAMLFFRGCCGYCGAQQSRRTKLTKDHVVPVSHGGLTIKRNIIPACVSCNCSKGDKLLDDWFPRHKKYTVDRMTRIREWTKR